MSSYMAYTLIYFYSFIIFILYLLFAVTELKVIYVPPFQCYKYDILYFPTYFPLAASFMFASAFVLLLSVFIST
jgi:hypothetical protein